MDEPRSTLGKDIVIGIIFGIALLVSIYTYVTMMPASSNDPCDDPSSQECADVIEWKP